MVEEGNKLEIALNWTIQAKNMLDIKGGFSPNQLVFGENHKMGSNFEDRNRIGILEEDIEECIILDHLKGRRDARKIHIKLESEERIKKALERRIIEHKIEDAQIGEKVYYKRENDKRWRGPAKVIGVDGKTLIVNQGSDSRKVNRIHITIWRVDIN